MAKQLKKYKDKIKKSRTIWLEIEQWWIYRAKKEKKK
jgi:hypothetical protein